jgi:hypothetical protein
MRGMDSAGRRGGWRGSGRLGDGWGAVVIGSGGQWASRRLRAVGAAVGWRRGGGRRGRLSCVDEFF